MRARYYDPALGRFLSEDPIGIADGLNLYAYAGNYPVNMWDPTGLGYKCYTFQLPGRTSQEPEIAPNGDIVVRYIPGRKMEMCTSDEGGGYSISDAGSSGGSWVNADHRPPGRPIVTPRPPEADPCAAFEAAAALGVAADIGQVWGGFGGLRMSVKGFGLMVRGIRGAATATARRAVARGSISAATSSLAMANNRATVLSGATLLGTGSTLVAADALMVGNVHSATPPVSLTGLSFAWQAREALNACRARN